MKKKHINWSKKTVYDVTPGVYSCKIVDMYDVKGRGACSSPSKILFAPVGQKDPLKLSVVAKEYCLDVPNEWFTQDLQTIFEGRLDEHLDADGDFDYKTIVGREVVALVEGYHGGDHKNPYTFVTHILPKDTLKASQRIDPTEN